MEAQKDEFETKKATPFRRIALAGLPSPDASVVKLQTDRNFH